MLFGTKSEPKEPILSVESNFGAPNAALCAVELETILSQKKAKGAVLKLYLENFKLFNDTFGYAYGELLLKEVALFLEALPGARVYRYGGVEFVVILDKQQFTATMELAQQIRDKFEETWHINDMDYMCAMSLGVVFYPDAAQTAGEALKALEFAVSEAAQDGQNAVAVFNSELQKKLYRRHKVAKLISESLNADCIEIRYRPTFDLEKGVFSRAESYLRIRSAEFGLIGAAEFTPVAEDSGQICAVNSYAIHEICKQIRMLLDKGIEFESIAVPISPSQLLQQPFLGEMEQILKEYDIPRRKLAFEITESVLINSFNKVNVVMQELSDLGIELVLNEFGTGYSGINNILDLPVDVLKLEKMFVWQLETNPKSGYLIEGLIQIAHKLGLKIVAEGVETENQYNLLREYQCRYEQGFYYAPTVNAEELAKLLGNLDARPATLPPLETEAAK